MSSAGAPADAMGTLVLRPARAGDVGQLLSLHARVFGRALSPAARAWKLGDHSAPVENVWVAEVDGRIVFQYAGVPIRFRHRARDVWAMHSVDTMADPVHRRRGLLTQTATVTFARWREAGVAFVFGVPNQNWGKRLAALGFVQVAEVRWWVRWLDPFRSLATKVGLPWFSAQPEPALNASFVADGKPVDDPASLDAFWARSADEGVIRNGAWFDWRYRRAPQGFHLIGASSSGYPLDGLVAFRREGASGLIAEVHGADLETTRSLLMRACDELRGLGAERATLLIQAGTPLEEAALASGFFPRPYGFPVVAADLGAGLPRAALFQGGDFDVV